MAVTEKDGKWLVDASSVGDTIVNIGDESVTISDLVARLNQAGATAAEAVKKGEAQQRFFNLVQRDPAAAIKFLSDQYNVPLGTNPTSSGGADVNDGYGDDDPLAAVLAEVKGLRQEMSILKAGRQIDQGLSRALRGQAELDPDAVRTFMAENGITNPEHAIKLMKFDDLSKVAENVRKADSEAAGRKAEEDRKAELAELLGGNAVGDINGWSLRSGHDGNMSADDAIRSAMAEAGMTL